MKPIYRASVLAEADQNASVLGIPPMVLMERASLAAVEELFHTGWPLQHVTVLCGFGNNGGDGVAIARILHEHGIRAEIVLAGPAEKYSDQLKQQIRIAEHLDIPMKQAAEWQPKEVPDVLVDALFGIGLHRQIEGLFADCITKLNGLHEKGAHTMAIDIPSGVHADTGAVMGVAVQADVTVTFTSGKAGVYLYPGAGYAGEVIVREIGIPMTDTFANVCDLYALEDADLKHFPVRDPHGNKGSFGKVLVIAGSARISGAAYLSAKAALTSGVGMVKLYTHEANRIILATLLPEALITTYSDQETKFDSLDEDLRWADTVLIGPGLGTDDTAKRLLNAFFEKNQSHKLPTVFDADALNMMAGNEEYLWQITFPSVATPHLGEMSRLTGFSIRDIQSQLVTVARHTAVDLSKTLVLKDARTVTAYPNGVCFLNLSGNSGMATAGSGDVLAGILAALMTLCRDCEIPVEAMAVYVHGRCGDLAGEALSEASVTATDLIRFLPKIL